MTKEKILDRVAELAHKVRGPIYRSQMFSDLDLFLFEIAIQSNQGKPKRNIEYQVGKEIVQLAQSLYPDANLYDNYEAYHFKKESKEMSTKKAEPNKRLRKRSLIKR